VTKSGHAKVLDFGVAKVLLPKPDGLRSDQCKRRHRPDRRLVTWWARSPICRLTRRWAKKWITALDLFSFGVVLYEMATGVPRFAEILRVLCFNSFLHKAPAAPVPAQSGFAFGLERIINKALEKDRNLRYQSAAEISTDLRRLRRKTQSDTSEVGVIAGSDRAALSSRFERWSLGSTIRSGGSRRIVIAGALAVRRMELSFQGGGCAARSDSTAGQVSAGGLLAARVQWRCVARTFHTYRLGNATTIRRERPRIGGGPASRTVPAVARVEKPSAPGARQSANCGSDAAFTVATYPISERADSDAGARRLRGCTVQLWDVLP